MRVFLFEESSHLIVDCEALLNINTLKNTLSKKAYTYIAIFFAIILIVSIFAGCGTDTITGGNGNPPPVSGDSLIFSLDSFTVYSDHAPRTKNYQYNDTTTQSRKYRVVCNGISNIPVTFIDTAYFKYICLPYPNGNVIWLESRNNEIQNLHIDYTFTEDSTYQYTHIRHYLDFGFNASYPSTLDHFITLKSFNLYLVR